MQIKSHFVWTGSAEHSKWRRRPVHFTSFDSVGASFDPFFQVSRRLSTAQNLLQLLTQKAWTLRLACARRNKVISKLTGPPPTPLLCFVIFLMHESSDFCSPAWKRLYLPSPPLPSAPSFFISPPCLSPRLSHLRRGYLQPHNSRQINSFDVAQSHISSPPSLTGNRFRHGNQDAFTSEPLIDT